MENLFSGYISDITAAHDFFGRKANLLNTSMSQLNLPYRFKWFWDHQITGKKLKTASSGVLVAVVDGRIEYDNRVKAEIHGTGVFSCSQSRQYVQC